MVGVLVFANWGKPESLEGTWALISLTMALIKQRFRQFLYAVSLVFFSSISMLWLLAGGVAASGRKACWRSPRLHERFQLVFSIALMFSKGEGKGVVVALVVPQTGLSLLFFGVLI
ncbi:MAG: hypothetical protein U5N86_04710 [Planctomycetota bacterium]|nr:hypothetical protein [Planctomycetota bacterium]